MIYDSTIDLGPRFSVLPLNHLLLLFDHGGQLGEYLTQLDDRAFDVLHRVRPFLNVRVRFVHERQLRHLLLHVRRWRRRAAGSAIGGTAAIVAVHVDQE